MTNSVEKVEVQLRESDVVLMREYRLDPGQILKILGTSFAGILRRNKNAGQAMRDFNEPAMISAIRQTAKVMEEEREAVNKLHKTRRMRRQKKVKRFDE